MVTLASGSRTVKLLPALARHGVPLTADTFGSLRGILHNASGDEVVREVLAASGRNEPALIACSRFTCQGGGPFPHYAGQCVGHAPQSGQSIAALHETQLANACDAVTDLQLNPARTTAASDPLYSFFRLVTCWQEWTRHYMELFRALMERRVAWDNGCLNEILLDLGAILSQQHQQPGRMQPIHGLALESVEAGWVAGLKRILRDARSGTFSTDSVSGKEQLVDLCSALLQGGAVHVAAACCHAEMLAFLLEPDSSDPLLDERLRVPAGEALRQPQNHLSPPRALVFQTLSWLAGGLNENGGSTIPDPNWMRIHRQLGRVQFPPLALALAFGWTKLEAGSDALLRTLAILVKQGAPVDGIWKTESCGSLNWEDLVMRCGHGRAVYELLVKASSRGGAAVSVWLERAEQDGQLNQLIADLEQGEEGLGVSKATSSAGLLARRHSAVEQLAACQADIKPQHRAKLNELALELCQGRDDELAPRRIELLCLLLQRRLVLLEEHDVRGTSVGSQLLFAAVSANAAATVAQPCCIDTPPCHAAVSLSSPSRPPEIPWRYNGTNHNRWASCWRLEPAVRRAQ